MNEQPQQLARKQLHMDNLPSNLPHHKWSISRTWVRNGNQIYCFGIGRICVSGSGKVKAYKMNQGALLQMNTLLELPGLGYINLYLHIQHLFQPGYTCVYIYLILYIFFGGGYMLTLSHILLTPHLERVSNQAPLGFESNSPEEMHALKLHPQM